MTSPIPIPADPQLAIDHGEMRWCADCGGPAVFVPCFNVGTGRVGVCRGCDKEVFVPFTRTNSEAA